MEQTASLTRVVSWGNCHPLCDLQALPHKANNSLCTQIPAAITTSLKTWTIKNLICNGKIF